MGHKEFEFERVHDQTKRVVLVLFLHCLDHFRHLIVDFSKHFSMVPSFLETLILVPLRNFGWLSSSPFVIIDYPNFERVYDQTERVVLILFFHCLGQIGFY